MTRQSLLARLGLPAMLLLVAAFYLASYRGILFAPGHVYQNWDQSIPPYSSELRAYGQISRDAWSGIFEMGSPGVFTGINRAFDLLMCEGLSFLGGPLLARWYFLVYALIGAAGYWRLARLLGLGFGPSLAVCLLGCFNPRTYSLAVAGHGFQIGFALMLVPWMAAFAESARRSRRAAFLANALAAGLAAGLGFSASPIGLALTAAFLAVWTLAASAHARSLKPLAVAAVTGAVVVCVQLHWLLPAASVGTDGAKYNTRLEDVRAHYLHLYRDYSVPPRLAMIGTTDNLGMGTEQAYPLEGPFKTWWEVSAYVLLGLALLGLLGRSKGTSLKLFAALCLLAGFWLLTGARTIPGRILYEGILGRAQMVFFLMARPMRWLPLYQTGLALLCGLGLQAVADRDFWRLHRAPGVLAGTLTLAALAVYLAPWWEGDITRPRNETTQTMALMPQPLPDEERRLVAAVNADPGLYRITVLPTISSPTGDVPEPPRSSLTRNFGLLGKDSLMGPAFIGQSYGRFLLSLAHRRVPGTDGFGRLLGLGAVERVFFDSATPYLSYYDYGWMPRTKRGTETLSDPDHVLSRFLAAQNDLTPDPRWTFGQFEGFTNTEALPRFRVVREAGLAAGGAPLLASLADTPCNPFAGQAYFFGTDMDGPEVEALGNARSGVTVLGDGWPELLLPWLGPHSWIPAWTGPAAPPTGWTSPGDRWHQSIWFSDSPLSGACLWSRAAARLDLPLPGSGPHRVFARVLALPGQWGTAVSFGGGSLAEAAAPDPLDRGWRWLDLGVLDLGPGSRLRFEAPGPGAVVAGVLAAPVDRFQAALDGLDRAFPASDGTTLAVQAEACAAPGSALYAAARSVPLLGTAPGLSFTQQGLRPDGLDGTGGGTLAAEGDQVATAEFRLDLPQAAAGFTLTCFPRLFGDPGGLAFVRGEWSGDGERWLPLFEIPGRTDGKWEDVYGRSVSREVRTGVRSVRLRFTLRQAQLCSLTDPPNRPMRLDFTPASPYPGAASLGQAVLLPATFSLKAFRPGAYRVRARLLTPDGPVWRDLGVRDTAPDGSLDLTLPEPVGSACDLFILEHPGQARPRAMEQAAGTAGSPGGAPPVPTGTFCSILPQATPGQACGGSPPGPEEASGLWNPAPPSSPLEACRLNQASYRVSGDLPRGGLLLFSENYHSRWVLGEAVHLKAYGFMNAYVLPAGASSPLDVLFTPQRLRELGGRLTLAAWLAAAGGCLLCALLAGFQSRRKKGKDSGTT